MGLWNAVFPRPEPKPVPVKELPKELLAIGTIVAWNYESLPFGGFTASIKVKTTGGPEFEVPISLEQFTEIQKLTETEGIVKIGVTILPEEFW